MNSWQTVHIRALDFADTNGASARQSAIHPLVKVLISGNRFRSLLGLILLAVLGPLGIYGQSGMGTILGTVKDSSGAVVPGVTVTIRNIDTNVIRTVVTAGDGSFRMPALKAGNYEAKAEHAGFQSVAQQGIVLAVSQEQVVNFAMPVGAAQEVVEVTTALPLVDTTDSQINAMVGEHAIADLPLNGRNYVDLVLMQPGTNQDYAVGGTGGAAATTFSNHGSTPWSNLFTLDGAILNNALQLNSASQTGNTLGIDGIQEFKVVGIPDASYGLVMGGQVVMASKGGTNQFHGDIFEYIRNSVFDARNYFDAPKIPHFAQNQFGASLGGPIKKDKTFFFAVFESLRYAKGQSIIDTVPGTGCLGPANAIIWNGQGTAPVGAYNPTNPCTQLGTASLVAPTVPGNTYTNAVTISPTMAPLLALYPSTGPNLPNNQWTYPGSNYASENYGQIRIDHSFSASDSLFGRLSIDDGSLDNTQAFPLWRQTLPGLSGYATVGETHVFSSALINALRLSVSRTTQQVINVFTKSDFLDAQHSFVAGLPMGSWGGFSGISGMGPQTTKPSLDNLTLYTIGDDLSKTKGRHTLRVGVLLNLYRQGAGTNGNANGSLSFSSLGNFMAGNISGAQELSLPPGIAPVPHAPNVNRYFGYSTYGFYGQDDWRMTQRLTVNLGVRYEPMDTVNELNGNGYAMVNFPTATSPTKGPIMVNPTLKNFSPRVGFAYDVDGKGRTSLRGGFGIYRDIGNIGSELREQIQGTPPWAISSLGAVNNISLPLNFGGGVVGKSLQILGHDTRAPYAMEYNLTLERQFLGIGISATYVGLHGIHLWTRGEGNPVTPTGYLANGNPFYTNVGGNQPGVTGKQSACELNGIASGGVTTFCRLNPNYSVVTLDTTAGTSWYNSGELNITRPVSHGVEFQTSYTWSKALDDTEDMGGFEQGASGCMTNSNPLNRRADRGPACFDTTNKWNANMIYHLPKTGRENIVGKLVNGWYVSNIVTIQSGVPFTPLVQQNRSNSGVFIQNAYDDHVNVNTAASLSNCASPCSFIPYDKKRVALHNPTNWFNPYMFSLAPVGQMGNAGRDMLRSPSLLVWNASAVKDTAVHFLGDAGSLQFRAELFNPINKANFGLPAGAAFTGALTDAGAYSETAVGATTGNPMGTAGRITSTLTSSRQIQFALKLLF